MKTLYLCTTSKSKVEQFAAFFRPHGYDVKQVVLEIPEIQSVDPATVASEKLRVAARLTNLRPVVVDDAGIEIDDIEGFPGALLKPILEHGGVRLLGKLASSAQRGGRARATLVSAIAVDTGSTIFEGKGFLRGALYFSDEDRWEDKDSTGIFFPDGSDVSLQQLRTQLGETAFSHRLNAMQRIHELIKLECSRKE